LTRISNNKYRIGITRSRSYYAVAFRIMNLCFAFGFASKIVISFDLRARKFRLKFHHPLSIAMSETAILFYEPSILEACEFTILLPNPQKYEICLGFFLSFRAHA